ncbi:MAG: hypothetical protein WCP55_00340 [Lentisphaerota bacterium]
MSGGISRVNGHATPGWFVGRELQWLKIKRFDTNNGGLDQAAVDLVVAILQRHAEVFFVGEPHVSDSWGKMMVLVALNTFNDGNDTTGNIENNPRSSTLEADLQAASLGGDGVMVEYWAIYDGDQFGQI